MFLAHGFEVAFAIAGFCTALQFILDQEVRAQTAVGALGALFAWSWTILFLIGSTGILVGMYRLEDRIELAGLSCFSAAALVNAASIIQVRGLQGVYVALVFLAFVGGSLTRIHLLLALRRLGSSGNPSRGE